MKQDAEVKGLAGRFAAAKRKRGITAAGRPGAAQQRAPGPSVARRSRRTVPAAPVKKGVARRRDLSILWFSLAVVLLAAIGAWMLGRGAGETTQLPSTRTVMAVAADAAVTRAMRALAEGSESERMQAAEYLGGLSGESVVVEPLMKALAEDQSAKVRSEAARSLGRIGDPRAVDTLMRAAASDESADVRSRAMRALGEMHAEAAVDVLIDGLDAKSTFDGATEALVALGETSVAPLSDRVRGKGGRVDPAVLDPEQTSVNVMVKALIAAYKSPAREG